MPALQHEACEQLLNLGEDWILAKTNCLMLPPRERLDSSPKQKLGSFVAREMLCVPAATLPKQGSALKGSTAKGSRMGTGDRWEGKRISSSHCLASVEVKQVPFCGWRLLCQVIRSAGVLTFTIQSWLSSNHSDTFKNYSLVLQNLNDRSHQLQLSHISHKISTK